MPFNYIKFYILYNTVKPIQKSTVNNEEVRNTNASKMSTMAFEGINK